MVSSTIPKIYLNVCSNHGGHPQDDVPFLGYLKPILGGGRSYTKFSTKTPQSDMEVYVDALAYGADKVITTSAKLLWQLLDKPKKIPALDDYAGSIIRKHDMEWLILNPLEHFVTTNIGKHLFERYLSKFVQPDAWPAMPEFKWEIFDPSKLEEYYARADAADFISFDIETVQQDLAITCCGFCFVDLKRGSYFTITIPFLDTFAVEVARKLLAHPAAKVTQNGKYDIAYLLRYNSPPTNWCFDTQDMFFSWYSEFPKRLDFIASYMLRDWVYWKSESNVPINSYEYLRYNAKDCFATATIMVRLLEQMPQWALENFKQRMPVNYPCIVAESLGEKIDIPTMSRLELVLAGTIKSSLLSLQRMVDCFEFNPNSPDQTQNLFKLLGCSDVKGTGKIPRDKVSSRHAINKRILSSIERIRKDRKLRDTYLVEDKLLGSRCFYVLNASGTDTGRLASKESHFWCGLQIHNIPRDRDDIQIKECFISDAGFYHGEADGEQAEARDVAYLSGDLKLIETVESPQDYHTLNATRFFGLPYAQVDKPIRQLSKNVNHGTNYNMGANVLIDTMGIENVIRAKMLLKLPDSFSLRDVAQYLLDSYDKAYPTVRGPYYEFIRRAVRTTHLLIGPTGWTRYCFGNPDKNKNDLNSYVAHCGQSLNAMWLNIGYVKVFNEVYLHNIGNFKLGPQIHDSIKFQYRIGFAHLALQVKNIMYSISIPVRDIYGIERSLRIPVALKGESTIWSKMIEEKKWGK